MLNHLLNHVVSKFVSVCDKPTDKPQHPSQTTQNDALLTGGKLISGQSSSLWDAPLDGLGYFQCWKYLVANYAPVINFFPVHGSVEDSTPLVRLLRLWLPQRRCARFVQNNMPCFLWRSHSAISSFFVVCCSHIKPVCVDVTLNNLSEYFTAYP